MDNISIFPIRGFYNVIISKTLIIYLFSTNIVSPKPSESVSNCEPFTQVYLV